MSDRTLKGAVVAASIAVCACVAGDTGRPSVAPAPSFDYQHRRPPLRGPDVDNKIFAAVFAWLTDDGRRHLVVADQTVPICPVPLRFPLCFSADEVVSEARRHPEWGHDAEFAVFAQSRVQALPPSLVTQDVGIVSVPPEMDTRKEMWWGRLLRGRPNHAAFAMVAAPVYTSHERALVKYQVPLDFGGILFLIERNGEWRVATSAGSVY